MDVCIYNNNYDGINYVENNKKKFKLIIVLRILIPSNGDDRHKQNIIKTFYYIILTFMILVYLHKT